MSIMRIAKPDEPYAQIYKSALNDARMSFRAKGFYAYLMSKPNDWRINIKHLEKISPNEGREAVRKAMKELENCGYLVKQYTRGEKGRMTGWDYTLYQTPHQAEMAAEDVILEASPNDGFPSVGKPSVGKPTVGKPSPTNKEDVTQNRESTKEIKQTHTQPGEPSVPEMSVSEFIESWNDITEGEGLPKITEDGARSHTLRKKIERRLAEHPTIAFWEEVMNRCWETPFLRGEKGGWQATLHWLVENDVNAVKVYEGNYNGKK